MSSTWVSINLLNSVTAYDISGLQVIAKYIKVPIALVYGTDFINSISAGSVGDISYDGIKRYSIGDCEILQLDIPNV